MLNFHRFRFVQLSLLSITSVSMGLSPAAAQVGGNISIEAPILTIPPTQARPIQIRPTPLPPSSFPTLGETTSSGGNISIQTDTPLRIAPIPTIPIGPPSLNSPLAGEDIIRTREEEPLLEEPFFEGLGVDVALTIPEAATSPNTWFALAPQPSAAQSGLVVQELSISLIGTTGATEQHLVVNAIVQNLDDESSLGSGTAAEAQMLLMAGDRVVATQALAAPLQPGQTLPVEYKIDGPRPQQPLHLAYRSGNQTIALYPQGQEQSYAQRANIQELREQDLLK